jgi:hypothetical protein
MATRPVALVVAGVVIGVAVWIAASSATSSAPHRRAPRTFETTLYFLVRDASAPAGVRRALRARAPHALEALDALLAGPTVAERSRGLVTLIPRAARLVSLRLAARREGTDAFVSVKGLPPVAGLAPARQPSVLMRIRVLTQIARTLIGLSDIARVWVRVSGRPWDLPRTDGRLGDSPTDYDRLRGWWRICAGQRTASERAAGLSRCFAALP